MYGRAALPLSGVDNRLVDAATIHSRTSIGRKQGGMDIEYASGKGRGHLRRQNPEEPREHDKVDFPLTQKIHDFTGAGGPDLRREIQRVGPEGTHACGYRSVASVVDDEFHFHTITVSEETKYIFGVGAFAGCEDG